MDSKRKFDLIFATAAALPAAIIALPAAFVMAAANRSWPLYEQERVGLGGKTFKIKKIKSMNDARGADGHFLPDPERTTRVGVILRKSRIDELPQLINVFRGEMSMVGPRPLPLHDPLAQDARRQSVLPGLTGAAQVKGKNTLSNEEMLQADSGYVDHHTIWDDIKLIADTPLSLFRNRKASHYRAAGQMMHSALEAHKDS